MESNNKPKAVIWYHATRPCLKENLELLYKNFNSKYNYPVIVTSFGRPYSEKFIDDIHKNIDASIKFIEVAKPEIPAHIKEEELFYHRTEIDYVKRRFPKSRIGFLHTNQFVTGGIQEMPEMQQYDYVLKMDDDTFILKEIDFDLFEFMANSNYKFGPFAVKKYDYKNALDCQIGFRELVKEFIKKNNIISLSSAIDSEGEWDNVGIFDPTIWDLRIFRTENWKKWWNYINESGGIYKYRWGDQEIHIIYTRMFYPNSAWHNFSLYENGTVIHGGHGTVYQRGVLKNFVIIIAKKILKLLKLR